MWEQYFPSIFCSHIGPSDLFRENIALSYTRASFFRLFEPPCSFLCRRCRLGSMRAKWDLRLQVDPPLHARVRRTLVSKGKLPQTTGRATRRFSYAPAWPSYAPAWPSGSQMWRHYSNGTLGGVLCASFLSRSRTRDEKGTHFPHLIHEEI